MNTNNWIFKMSQHSIWCGMLIGIGGLAYLTVGGPLGALLFSFGLIGISHTGYRCLFTGIAGVDKPAWRDWFSLLWILIMNFIGCTIIASIARFGEMDINTNLEPIINSRLNSDYFALFARSIFTGIIMHLCVWIAKYKQNYIPILLGVPLFILCGFPHCIADTFYYSFLILNDLNFSFILPWIVSVIGNMIGCNVAKYFDVCPEN